MKIQSSEFRKTAVVAGLFSLFVFAFLVVNQFKAMVVDPQPDRELETLKIQLRNGPDNRQLIDQIRQLDLQIRKLQIQRRDFSRKGIYLLVAGILTFLICVKWAETIGKKVSVPQHQEDVRDVQLRQAKSARRAVIVGSFFLASSALIVAILPKIDFVSRASRPRIAGWKPATQASYPSQQEISKNWPGFRGPSGSGISAYTNVPMQWDSSSGQGILWKTEVPLRGHNSPVLWEGHVFLSGADENKREIYCFDAFSGKLLWTAPVLNANVKPAKVTEEAGYAAPTVVTDGRVVCAIFPTGDVGCFDFEGKKIWTINLGTPDSTYGYASSLAMYQNLLLIQYDQGSVEQEKSKLIALDVFSGRTVWETKRPVPGSWSSPIVAQTDSGPQIITCANPWVIAYDPDSGAELWRVKCLSGDVAPSPIYVKGLVFAIEPYARLVAIKTNMRGEAADSAIAWSIDTSAPDICSPVTDGEFIYLLTTDGTLSCLKVADGTMLWEHDFRSNFFASPSMVGNRVYLLSDEGTMFIIESGPEYKELARCKLGEKCHASPAFAEGRIYIRDLKYLYCIGGAAYSLNPKP